MQLFRTKPLEQFNQTALKRCLTSFDLILLGIGAIIGAGVFVLTGVAAATKAGPAIVLSYLFSGIACAFTAFSYAELSAAIGGSGSAYGYAYAGLGEFFAWIIGWSLILEYSIAVSAVAIGWSSYVNNVMTAVGLSIPFSIAHSADMGGIINLPAFLIIFVLAGILCLGVRESARFNNIVVFIKFLSIAIFAAVAFPHVQVKNWIPFAPFGWNGIVNGAALIFFAYIGFDAVSTAAEEAINPQKDLPKGIIGSLIICTLIYILVAGILCGIVSYTKLDVASPVSYALLSLGHNITAGIVAAGAIAGLTTVMLVMFYGLTRIIYAMSHDGLLPSVLSRTSAKNQSPVAVIIGSGIIIALVSGFMPIEQVAELVNIGTLAAFVVVSLGVIVMRHTKPDMLRPFKVPLYPIIPVLGITLCTYLMFHLSLATWWRFIIWMAVGFIIYFSYSYRHSMLNQNK